MHLVDVDLLRQSYFWLQRKAAAGVDGVTWQQYGEGLEERLVQLHGRIHRNAYQATPSRRQYIPKADGRMRPLGIAALEDKIVQRALVEVLNAVYEQDFLGFSYGFRPQRSQHQALDALAVGITRTNVSWIVDADIKNFFDQVNHDWLLKFLRHRIGDPRGIKGDYKFTDAFPIAEGFEDNVEFFTMTYEAPLRVASNREFANVAPLLWMRAGSRGRRIVDLSAGWDVAEVYGVLANLDHTQDFLKAVAANNAVAIAFIVTDEERLFESVAQELPAHVEPVRLYESYLRNFEIESGRVSL
jgi:hypothetical protein